ncbi:unnamed protein product [Amoebophrya sp. A25]|nr:unnamed protein product [Amoebophrya sp. A25]|eukprot:GSA25T00020334001.1
MRRRLSLWPCLFLASTCQALKIRFGGKEYTIPLKANLKISSIIEQAVEKIRDADSADLVQALPIGLPDLRLVRDGRTILRGNWCDPALLGDRCCNAAGKIAKAGDVGVLCDEASRTANFYQLKDSEELELLYMM